MTQQPIYLDYSATTPVAPEVASAMSQCLQFDGNFGNPASRSHVFGWRAEEAVEEARAQMADLLNCDPREIVWTSGATESDNLAIKGAVEPFPDGHIITSQIEHKAVLDTCAWLERRGYEVTYLAPTAAGWVDPDDVRQALREDTRIVSIMHSNNEIGVLNDIRTIGDIVQRHGALFHVDAAQTVGKIPVDLADLPVDLLSVSAHKFYGPKGIGVLYVRRAIAPRVLAQIHGGGHERGMRSGTLATHQIVGIGAAAHLAGEHLEQEGARIRLLRDRLWRHLAQMPGVRANGDLEQRVPGNLNVGFEGVDGEALLQALDDIAVSSGSACTSATVEPSYVLKALGLPDDVAHASLRITVGRYTSAADVDVAAARIQEVVARLREFEASRSQ